MSSLYKKNKKFYLLLILPALLLYSFAMLAPLFGGTIPYSFLKWNLMSGKKDIRPPTIRYRELIHKLDAIERDVKVIAMKESLKDTDRICIMAKLEDIKKLMNGKFMGGNE